MVWVGRTFLTDIKIANEISKTVCQGHHITHKARSNMQTSLRSSSQNINFFLQESSEISLQKPKEVAYHIINLKAKKSPGEDQVKNIL